MSGDYQALVKKAPPNASAVTAPIDILLLMKPPEAAFCGEALHKVNPALTLARAGCHEEIDLSLGGLSDRARLIGFSTSVVVAGKALNAFGGGCFNFHPGPPEYPGNRPSAFANYDGAKQFGVTFHEMIASVDAGMIYDCERFTTAGIETARDLAVQAYFKLAGLFINNVIGLALLDRPMVPNGEVWSGRKTRLSDYNAMRRVSADLDPTELDRRIRAFSWVYTPLDPNWTDA